MKKKITAIAAVTAILAMALSGTLAYLKTETNTVTNTFTIQGEGVHIYFQETGAMQGENGFAKDYVFVPGMELSKDPTVKLAAGSKPCYVFVEVVEEHNTYGSGSDSAKLLSYAVNSEWTALDAENSPGVYYHKVDTAPTELLDLPVLAGNKVTVDEDCTQEQLNEIVDCPSITFNASAISLEGTEPDEGDLSDATAAWNALNASTS